MLIIVFEVFLGKSYFTSFIGARLQVYAKLLTTEGKYGLKAIYNKSSLLFPP